MTKTLRLSWHAASVRGQRADNQDRVCVTPVDARAADTTVTESVLPIVMVLCDGVGGEQGGALAAGIAVDAAYGEFHRRITDGPEHALCAAIEAANHGVTHEAQRTRLSSMASTIVLAAVIGHDLHVAHVGDSRVYVCREGRVERLTNDHVREPDDRARGRSEPLTRALGDVASHRPDLAHRKLQLGDRVLLCSDGLHKAMVDADLARCLAQARTPEEATTHLIQKAIDHRSPDNISAVVLFFGERQHAEVSASTVWSCISNMGVGLFVGVALGWWLSAGAVAGQRVGTTEPTPLASGEPMATQITATVTPITPTPTLVVPTQTPIPARAKPRQSASPTLEATAITTTAKVTSTSTPTQPATETATPESSPSVTLTSATPEAQTLSIAAGEKYP